jgi:hypothetical protein
LITTQPEPVEVGGLQGVVIDMSLDPTWTGGCPFSGGLPLVAFLTDSTPGGFDLTVDPGEQGRRYLLQHTAGVIAIDVGAEKPFKLDPADWVGPPLQEVVAMATPILDELRFAA